MRTILSFYNLKINNRKGGVALTGKIGMKIRKGDQVLIISGKDRGKKGGVLRAFPQDFKIIVEGVNIRKKATRPKRAGEKGQIVQKPAPIDISNIKLICPKCGKATKVSYKIEAEKKYRICKKCGQEI